MEKPIPLGRYLWERIKQTGVSRIFGVPGDFNLTLLDHIYDVKGLEWIGSTNELNAAYSADGYARVKKGAGCLVTTHGVGELSALNGIAGSMTESVKIIHVVGQTSMAMQKGRRLIHHSIGPDPDHRVFAVASEGFRVGAAELQSEQGAAEGIDRVLRECFVKSGPVYIFLPIDLVDKLAEGKRLETPLSLEPEFDQMQVDDAAKEILKALYASQNPALFVDCLVARFDASDEARELADKLGILVYTSNMGKGIIDETHANYLGLCNGEASGPGVKAAFDASDLFLVLGELPSDTNTGGFTRTNPKENTIHINPHDVQLLGKQSFTVPIKYVLKALLKHVDATKIPRVNKPTLPVPPREEDADSKAITQSWLWHHLADTFFQPHDVVFGETGTAAFGIPDTTFSESINWVTQTYYGSIGYATPAALGAEIALDEQSRNPRGRTFLCTGDGSLMLTVQEVGNMVKQGLKPIIFIINNAGYTVERLIHGAEMSYNDIVPFNYEHMLSFFNMPAESAKECFHRATTKVELEEILKLGRVRKPETVQVVEIVMDKLDIPWRLGMQVAMRGQETIKEMKAAGFKVRDLTGKNQAFWG